MSQSTFKARVTHLSSQGLGVLKDPEGQTYFVRGVWPGDEGSFRSSDERDGSYRFAELLALDVHSSERQVVPCPHLGLGEQDCYGCPWMLASYPAQLRQKEHRVRYALERLGLKDPPVLPIWPSPEPMHYRCRAQFKTDGRVIGYAGRQGQKIAPIDDCLVLSPTMRNLFQGLRSRLPEAAWHPTEPHRWVFIDLDEDCDLNKLVLNQRRPFKQANPLQNERMRAWVEERVRQAPGPVLELFAGSGNFTEVLTKTGHDSITAIEVAANAVQKLAERAWPQVSALRLDLYKPWAAREIQRLCPDTATLLVNPPRDGLQQLSRLPEGLSKLKDVLYVSCDPGTLAQDLKRFVDRGFHLVTVQPLDQMPHTPHVEVLVHLTKP